MTSLQRRADPRKPHRAVEAAWPTFLFSITILLSAALLFMVQPMFARMILPRLGGTPATWNTCLLFFQTLLLGGYLYVHASTNRLTHRQHVVLHGVVVAAALLMLPLAMPTGSPIEGRHPVPWLLAEREERFNDEGIGEKADEATDVARGVEKVRIP